MSLQGVQDLDRIRDDKKYQSALVVDAGNAAIASYESKYRRKTSDHQRNGIRRKVAVGVFLGELNFDNLVSMGIGA